MLKKFKAIQYTLKGKDEIQEIFNISLAERQNMKIDFFRPLNFSLSRL